MSKNNNTNNNTQEGISFIDETILEEIKSDERLEKAYNFWVEYKQYILGAIALILLITTISVYWSHREYNRKSALSTNYFKAVKILDNKKATKSQINEAIALLREVSKDKEYGMFASFAIANYKSLKDEKDAKAEYEKIEANYNISGEYRDLATIKLGYMRIDDKDFADVLPKISIIANNPSSPWMYMAKELKAIILIKKGQKKEANTILDELLNDALASKETKNLAQALKNYS